MRVKHKATGLFLEVQFLGSGAENDLYVKDESDASTFKNKTEAAKVAKRLGLTSKDFTIE